MSIELTLLLRFETYPPTLEEIEDVLDCIVIEWTEDEV